MESYMPYFVGGIILLVVSSMVLRVIRHGGLKAAMFGARVDRTIGEVRGEKQGGVVGVAVRVHVLRRDLGAEKLVGVELVAKSFLSYQMMPVTLSESQAIQLAELLKEATKV